MKLMLKISKYALLNLVCNCCFESTISWCFGRPSCSFILCCMGKDGDNVPICCTLPGKVIQQHSSKNTGRKKIIQQNSSKNTGRKKIIQQHSSKNTARKKLFNRTVLKILAGKNHSAEQFQKYCQEKIIQQNSSKNTARKKLFNRTVLKILAGKNYSTEQF